MSGAASVDFEITPPAVIFGHFGINCDNANKLEDFYTRVFGFCVSDHGMVNKDTNRILFMTRRPREHHLFVLVSGRSSSNPTTVSETGFKAPNLDALRHAKATVEAEAKVSDVV
jgi:catechol-2,3-dioxygenase